MDLGREVGALTSVVPAERVRAMALEAGFDLCGFARPEPIPAPVLLEWLAAGMGADMDWLAERAADRLDPRRLLPGARTVVALACNYWTDGSGVESSPVARYARGRDYHATMRDRLRTLRRKIREHAPNTNDYGSVDANPVMEKVWAARAGLGYVGTNGCFITERFGSWVVLAAMALDVELDSYGSGPTDDRCGKCNLCVTACPTDAIVSRKVVDANRCISFQTIENEGDFPEAIRAQVEGFAFGCDLCQTACPLNDAPVLAGERFQPRPVAKLTALQLAQLTPEGYQQHVPGTPLARAGFDGLRRNAAYVLGAARDADARPVLERLLHDASARVREAARWALSRLDEDSVGRK